MNRFLAENKLEQWIDNPDTPDDAWKTYTWKQISEEVNISIGVILIYLPRVLARKMNTLPSTIIDKRNEYGYDIGRNMAAAPLPSKYRNQVNELLEQNPDMPTCDIAHITDLPESVIIRYLKSLE